MRRRVVVVRHFRLIACTRAPTPPASFLPSFVDRSETNFFTGDPLRSLSTLSYSENVDLQRSAALAFAEITEKCVWFPVPSVSSALQAISFFA